MFETSTTASVNKESTVETLFKPYTVPFTSALKLTLTAKAGEHHDSVERNIRVRPWGIEFASHAGGDHIAGFRSNTRSIPRPDSRGSSHRP